MSESMSAVASKPLEITQYNQVRADIEALKTRNASLVFDYEKPAGNASARSHVYKLRQKRADVERVRKAAKADALEYGRKVDAIAKELAGELDSMIDVHQKPLDEIEQREQQRVAAIRAKIDAMRLLVDESTHASAALKQRLAAIEAVAVTATEFAEFASEAEQVRSSTLTLLAGFIAGAERREAEAAELERLRVEAAERDRREREERIAREAAERARAEAEAKAKAEQEAARRREQEALEAERRALQAAREANERVERERAEAERRAAEAAARAKAEQEAAVQREREGAERRAREAAEAERRAEVERLANQRVRDAVIEEVASAIRDVVPIVTLPSARTLATAMLDGKIARVTVNTAGIEAGAAL